MWKKKVSASGAVVVLFFALWGGSAQMERPIPDNQEQNRQNKTAIAVESGQQESGKVKVNDLVARSMEEGEATEISMRGNTTVSISGLSREEFGDKIMIVLLDCDTGEQTMEEYHSGMLLTTDNGGSYYIYAVIEKNGTIESRDISDYIQVSQSCETFGSLAEPMTTD